MVCAMEHCYVSNKRHWGLTNLVVQLFAIKAPGIISQTVANSAHQLLFYTRALVLLLWVAAARIIKYVSSINMREHTLTLKIMHLNSGKVEGNSFKFSMCIEFYCSAIIPIAHVICIPCAIHIYIYTENVYIRPTQSIISHNLKFNTNPKALQLVIIYRYTIRV